MGESFKIALAIEILCFCPPDNLMPFSPIIVSYAWGRFSIKSAAAANSQASLIFFSLTVPGPEGMLGGLKPKISFLPNLRKLVSYFGAVHILCNPF